VRSDLSRMSLVGGGVFVAGIGSLLLFLHSKPESLSFPPGFDSVLKRLVAQYPMPVNVSPDGRFVLLKTRGPNAFVLFILERSTGRIVAETSSKDTQLELTWRPDSREVAYLASNSGEASFRLHLWNLRSGSVRSPDLPRIQTAARPLRWTPTGDRVIVATSGEDGAALILADVTKQRVTWTSLGSILPESDFQVSPSGNVLAYISSAHPQAVTVTPIREGTESVKAYSICRAGEVRDLAWSPDESQLICTARNAKDEFFALYALDCESRKVKRLIAPPFDLCHPRCMMAGKRIVYEMTNNGLSVISTWDVQTGVDRALKTPRALSRIVQESPDGDGIVVLEALDDAPPELVEFDLNGIGKSVVWKSRTQIFGHVVIPAFADCAAADGQRIHFYVWRPYRAKSGQRPEAIIVIHGGPRRLASPKWDANIQLATSEGTTVAIVNYRGSSGYGQRFEREYSPDAQAEDILQISHFLKAHYGIQVENQVILAESSGCSIAYRAALQTNGRFLGIILISPTELPPQALPAGRKPRFLDMYQGENDALRDAVSGEACVSSLLNPRDDNQSQTIIRVLESEGHNLQRVASWAEIYARLIEHLKNARH